MTNRSVKPQVCVLSDLESLCVQTIYQVERERLLQQREREEAEERERELRRIQEEEEERQREEVAARQREKETEISQEPDKERERYGMVLYDYYCTRFSVSYSTSTFWIIAKTSGCRREA